MNTVNIALVGLRFGEFFVELYKNHPNVGQLTLCDTNEVCLQQMAEKYDLPYCSSFEEILQDSTIDAVHLVTPIPLHEEQTVRVLEAGKHCACAVPMATSLEGIRRITEAVRKSGKTYMMMETTLYTYPFFYVKQMLESGELGRIQFLRGSHYQDMRGNPPYWLGLPPMWYATHALAPMISLSGSRVKRVFCFGSGTMDQKLVENYGNPFPVESMLLEFENGLKGEATRTLFETARMYEEGMYVYGSKRSFEWGFCDGVPQYVTTLEEQGVSHRQVEMPNFHEYLPEALQRYTVGEAQYDPLHPQESLRRGFGAPHHGSHPHLVHEFVRSLIEGRSPAVNEVLAGNITAAGVCAHESAMRGGESITVPLF